MTRRDLPFEARDKGRPWDTGKNVEQSSPLGLLRAASEVGHLAKYSMRLTVNGETKQNADLTELFGRCPRDRVRLALLSAGAGRPDLQRHPAGVGAVTEGDTIVVSIAGLSDCTVTIGAPARD